jgi:hypothetical protein
MSQNEIELLRFLDVLGRYGSGEASVGRDRLLERFDVLVEPLCRAGRRRARRSPGQRRRGAQRDRARRV